MKEVVTITREEYDSLEKDRRILDWMERDYAKRRPYSKTIRNHVGGLLATAGDLTTLLSESLAAWDCRNALTRKSEAG